MTAYIYGKDLLAAIKRWNANPKLPKFQKNEWVALSVEDNAYLLGNDSPCQEPFLIYDHWKTIKDHKIENIDGKEGWLLMNGQMFFINLSVSVSALKSATQLMYEEDKTKKIEEEVAQQYLNENFVGLLKTVCKWGGVTGNRVYGNIVAQQTALGDSQLNGFSSQLKDFLNFAARSPIKGEYKHIEQFNRQVMERGSALPGLGVSYASKILRLVYPDRYPVLDSIISEQFGFALNPAGYALFIDCLQSFVEKYPQLEGMGIVDVEAGLFRLIRNGPFASEWAIKSRG